ncbi:MAG: hypothetical protein ACJ8CB_13205, partial [Ktedonobacteraceae bacterium]
QFTFNASQGWNGFVFPGGCRRIVQPSLPDGKGGTMARYTAQIGTRSCCGKHRWPLVDVVETLATSGFEHILLEEVAFAGECVSLTLPLETGLTGDRVQALVDVILHRLSQALGSNALCFTGNLTVTASLDAEESRAQEGLTFIKSRGLSPRLEPIYLPASAEVM